MIGMHIAPPLSELDLMVARAVPPGGNWKDVPVDVPSKRLETIRASYARGEGSRSTYYGRLNPAHPSYTISTYFTRPGNGCHLHFDNSQMRTISYREAARLQSFPDSFEFFGSKTAIANQIGNAVPPLLAYFLANGFEEKGEVVDLFSGCGGLALGFKWAGWRSVLGSDIDYRALQTFEANISPRVVLGDVREANVRSEIEASVKRQRNSHSPLLVVGGPPCQGFSTAGKSRSRSDERNHLFRDYCNLVESLDPDAFIFENVTGLLNMEKGEVFKEILGELGRHAKSVLWWKVPAETYGVPQRRTRVIIVGLRRIPQFNLAPGLLGGKASELLPVSVYEALGDLPKITAGEDGSALNYLYSPQTFYQKLMRGIVDAQTYCESLSRRTVREAEFSPKSEGDLKNITVRGQGAL
ncbi:DNA (cytosine-5)-methyltransferase 1 [Jannaschia faecimaris]|uniref:DNA (cytosine-5-)-methyltransferase n=1 Tax=Jannaschia faecimaris TaxID=1244108 RepID=A0A1H3SKT1_9RHOB|nr:DNA (cytosine-5-)-methyltransferase [Jannaschia faecimaris]SDZ38300.1 DNA (cytosine-5)-methyltransferase 1 [Jannaschia faecimaris]